MYCAEITLAEVSVIMQLATSAILWPSPKPKLLERRLPWKLFSQMLVEVLRLPLVNSAPFNKDRLLLPTKGCLQLDDLIMLLASFMGQLGKGVVLKLKKEVPQESFQDAVWTGNLFCVACALLLSVMLNCAGQHDAAAER